MVNRVLLAFTVGLCLVVGVAARLAPLAESQRTIAAISEDGYLMLTVARNVALGRSLTIADGTIPTNGIQPLVTFAWAGAHWLYDGAREPTLRLIVVVQFILAIVTAVLVGLLARHLFLEHPWRDTGALIAASFWFASPLALGHTTNGLETGPSVCAIAAVLLADARWRSRSALRAVAIGGMLGGLFLIRNDAVFFILAFLATELRATSASHLVRRLRHTIIIGVTSVVVALPWLIYNVRAFGHIVPVSGRAQSLNVSFGENLMALPRVLVEFVWMATPVPLGFGLSWTGALVMSTVLITAIAVTVRRGLGAGLVLRRWVIVLLIHSALLCVYYGIFFGASYFLSRYLFPLSLVSVLLTCIWVMPRLLPSAEGGATQARTGLVIAAVLALLVTVSAVRSYNRSAVHEHDQAVQWVAEHVAPDVWVGAPQSGTLGYFHDRTLNLDGKVNPLALEARRDNRLFRYIVEDTEIEYLVDWYGLARWVDQPEAVQEERDRELLRRHFTVIVRDRERNLVVLGRMQPEPR